jgi:uncharacterized cupredoxin-like copper-binding protein
MAPIAAVAALAAVARIAAAVLRRAAVVAAVAATMLAAVAAAAIIRASAASAAAGKETGLGRILATDQSDAHEGKKRSHTEHNNAVHPRILQNAYRYRKSKTSCRHRASSRQPDGASNLDATHGPLPTTVPRIGKPCWEDLPTAKTVAVA